MREGDRNILLLRITKNLSDGLTQGLRLSRTAEDLSARLQQVARLRAELEGRLGHLIA
jgi:hypothetical protein